MKNQIKVKRKRTKYYSFFVNLLQLVMSTTTIARACSPKLILDISNHNIVSNGGNMLGKLQTFHFHRLS